MHVRLGQRITTEFDNREVTDDLDKSSFRGVKGKEVVNDDTMKGRRRE